MKASGMEYFMQYVEDEYRRRLASFQEALTKEILEKSQLAQGLMEDKMPRVHINRSGGIATYSLDSFLYTHGAKELGNLFGHEDFFTLVITEELVFTFKTSYLFELMYKVDVRAGGWCRRKCFLESETIEDILGEILKEYMGKS